MQCSEKKDIETKIKLPIGSLVQFLWYMAGGLFQTFCRICHNSSVDLDLGSFCLCGCGLLLCCLQWHIKVSLEYFTLKRVKILNMVFPIAILMLIRIENN